LDRHARVFEKDLREAGLAVELRDRPHVHALRAQRQQEAAARQRLADSRRPLQSKLKRLEEELARVSDELRELDARLADPDFYHAGHADEVAVTLKRRGELAGRVDELEARWIAVTTQLEAIA